MLRLSSGRRDGADNGNGSALSWAEARVLAALARRPQGLREAASVAAVAGIAHDEARRALGGLCERRLVLQESQPAHGDTPSAAVVVWRLLVGDAWFEVAEAVRSVPLPVPEPAPPPDRLPERFAHLFWWGDPAAIALPRDAAFVAEHILACHDIDAWGWAITSLPLSALERVADKDHTPPATRAMIRNAVRRRNGVSV